jgi:hypothetical protein
VSTLPLYGTPIRRFAPPSSTEAVGECSAKPGVRRCEKIAAVPPAVRKGSALSDRRLKIKLFGLSRLPETRRFSAQQAAQPHRPVANDFFTPSEGLCLNANELLAGVSDLAGPLSARDGYSSSLATEACSGMWPSKTL